MSAKREYEKFYPVDSKWPKWEDLSPVTQQAWREKVAITATQIDIHELDDEDEDTRI